MVLYPSPSELKVFANSLPIWPEGKQFPTLGHECAEWIEANLVHGPGDVRGHPALVTDDLYRFLCRALQVHPEAICGKPECECEEMVGKYVYKVCILSRLKGFAKTEAVAWIMHWKLSGNPLVTGWNGDNEPISGMVNSPYIPIAAVAEEQADDTLWGCFVAIASEAPALEHLKVTDRRVVNHLNYGEAKIVTSSSARNDGGKPSAIGLDEAHLLHGAELLNLGKVLERNLAKRQIADPQLFIATTMFMIGQGSYAEHLWDRADRDPVILYDHVQAADHWNTDDNAQLRSAILEAAGDASQWLSVRQLMSNYRADPNEGERYWLNRYGGGSNAKLINIVAYRESPVAEPLNKYDIISIGIDGSMSNDNTGIVACRLNDLSLHYLWHYEPDGSPEDAMAMAMEMDQRVQEYMSEYVVTRLYADPPFIQEYISKWSGMATQSKQRGMKPRIAEWWTNRHIQMANATREMATAISRGQQVHDHNPILMAHMANAYRNEIKASLMVDGKPMPGYIPRKQAPKSVKKIDLAVCAILARQAAVDSIAQGEDKKVRPPSSGLVSF